MNTPFNSVPMAKPVNDKDEFLWLEDLHSDAALRWVEAQNERTIARYTHNTHFRHLQRNVLKALNDDSQIPWFTKYGEYYYNFWQDASHPRGLLRRTTPDSYRSTEPQWETVLDIDALIADEDQEWVYHGIQVLAPEYRFCLLMLSPDGGDAVVIREFDLADKCFVSDGFYLPLAKSDVSWIDKDTLFIATESDSTSLTTSGYPRIARRWRRGTALNSAEIVYQAEKSDLKAFAWCDDTPGFKRHYVGKAVDFYRSDYFLLTEQGKKQKIDIPDDASFDTHKEWLLITLTSDWDIEGKCYPAGALLAARFTDFLAGQRELQILFSPTPQSALSSYSSTRDNIILCVMENVVSRLEILTPQADGWQRRSLHTPVEFGTISAYGLDWETNEYYLTIDSYLHPTSLYIGDLDGDDARLIKQDPALFDSSNYQVSQHFARSEDGTDIPYFQISARDLTLDGSHPTQLYGYGGFEVSLQPEYLGIGALSWLLRGGVSVIANIRGGGEYGPQWHQAALGKHRHRAYEDFAAVAQDLITRGITSPAHLGAQGGSNGGLLVGNMLTHYPQLFSCIICEVPLLDMYRYTQLSAGASWIAEYGDPNLSEEWAWLKIYSPYHNLQPHHPYPAILFYTATSDDRVNPAHARKMAARMQKMGYPQAYFYENTEGGHSAAADKQQAAFHAALISQFMWSNLTRAPDHL